jgi:DNA-binding transcriptional MerR regulator
MIEQEWKRAMDFYFRKQLAAAAGIHAETLRYYEKIDLIPAPVRNASGYRIFLFHHP